MKHNKGFTLIELMIVVVILAVLSLVATAMFVSIDADSEHHETEKPMIYKGDKQ